jgi:hypothetical protein
LNLSNHILTLSFMKKFQDKKPEQCAKSLKKSMQTKRDMAYPSRVAVPTKMPLMTPLTSLGCVSNGLYHLCGTVLLIRVIPMTRCTVDRDDGESLLRGVGNCKYEKQEARNISSLLSCSTQCPLVAAVRN